MTNLVQIAGLLETTMANAGILDDYDEIIDDIHDNDPIAAAEYHESVMAGFALINEQLDADYDITRDGSGKSGEYSLHMTYLNMVNAPD